MDVGCHDGEGGGDVEARGRLGEQRRRLAVQVDDKALSRVLRMDMGMGMGMVGTGRGMRMHTCMHIHNMRAHEQYACTCACAYHALTAQKPSGSATTQRAMAGTHPHERSCAMRHRTGRGYRPGSPT